MAIEVEELLQPIPGADPGGEDVGFSDVMDRMREARRADDPNLSQGDWQTEIKVADWRLVIDLGSKLLSRQSKDLQAAVWLAEAAIGRDGFAGAAVAFSLLGGLVENFWDGLYPRLDGDDADERASKLAWFNNYGSQVLRRAPMTAVKPAMTLNDWQTSREVDNLARQNADAHSAALAEGKVTGEQFDRAMADCSADFLTGLLAQLDGARTAYDRMKAVIDQKFGRAAPGLSDLDEALKRAQILVTKAAKAKGLIAESAADAPAEGEGAPAAAAGTPAGAQGFGFQASAGAAGREAALRTLSDISQFFRRTEPHSPVSFLVERAVSWANMPLDEWLSQVVSDDSVLSRIRDRTGIGN